MKATKRFDLHIHTHYSPCSINKPEDILRIAKKCGLNGIAITDHNSIKGSIVTKKLNKDKNFTVLLGEEVRTNYGDLLAIDITEQINKTNLFEVLDEIKRQGGISIIAHPFRCVPWLKFRYPINKLEGKVDGIETFNSRNILGANKKADRAITNLKFAKIGSSDAHLPSDIGKGYTIFEGDLRKAIKNRTTIAQGMTKNALFSGTVSFANKRILTPLKVKKRWT